MTPNRRETCKGVKVEQYWWAGKNVVYLDHFATNYTFDRAIKLLKEGKTKDDICVTIERNSQ